MVQRTSIKGDFKNLLDYHGWVNEQMLKVYNVKGSDTYSVSDKYVQEQIETDSDWYGKGTTLEQLKAGITEYRDAALIEKIYDQVQSSLSFVIKNRIKAKKVNYNSMGLGVFSFDRAAMGLYQLDEFFSPSLRRAVDAKDVNVRKSRFIYIPDGSPVTKRKEQRADGKPKLRTNNKKVFVYYPPQPKDKNAVELFLSCGGASEVSARDFLYSGVTAIVIAELLMKARIKVKINIVIGTSPNSTRNPYYGNVVPVKDYNEPLDRNLLALMSSDPRFYRYDGFKGIMAVLHHFGQPPKLDYGADGKQLKVILEDSGYVAENSVAEHRYYFGRTFSEQAALKEIATTINDLSKHFNE